MQRHTRLFVACILALVTTSFGFVSRALLINEWGELYNLSETQLGALSGAGLFPFAISIILFSLIIDRVGYGRTMAIAWIGHVVSAIVTVTANSYAQLYVGTLLFALANGAVEAVVNPVVATLYPREKTHRLNILHAGWPGGLVLGGVLAILLGQLDSPDLWRWKIGLFLLPTMAYGALLLGCRFPVQERVAAGVSYMEMLGEFGWAGCLIVSYFIARGIDEIVRVTGHALSAPLLAALTLIPTLVFAFKVRRVGRPVFILLLLIMVLLATTELGTDSWIAALLTPVLRDFGQNAGSWVLIYTSLIMFVLRFFAGPLAHRLTPLGLMAGGSVCAACGLFWIAHAGSAAIAIFFAATLYGIGKSFFWPTTLGIVSEQFPKGGALTLNAMGGLGMISVGVLGIPLLGSLQDRAVDVALLRENSALHSTVATAPITKYGLSFRPLDKSRVAALPVPQQLQIDKVRARTNQTILAQFAVLPLIMACCYAGLIFFYHRRGGYRPAEISEH